MYSLRGYDADVALTHMQLLILDVVDRLSLHHADHLQEGMGMPVGGKVAQVPVQLRIKSAAEEQLLLQTVFQKLIRKGVAGFLCGQL